MPDAAPLAPNVTAALRAGRFRVSAQAVLLTALCAAASWFTIAASSPPVWMTSASVAYLLFLMVVFHASTERRMRNLAPAPAALQDRAQILAARAGLTDVHVHVFDPAAPHKGTRKLKATRAFNAFAIDDYTPGATVVLGSHLLTCLHEKEEDAIVAHELGHVAHASALHFAANVGALLTWKTAMWLCVLSVVLFGAGSTGRVEALGLVVVVNLAFRAAQGYLSRMVEHAADRTGVALTGAPLDLASALTRLAALTPVLRKAYSEAQFLHRPLAEALADSGQVTEPLAPMSRAEISAALPTLPGQHLTVWGSHPTARSRARRLVPPRRQ